MSFSIEGKTAIVTGGANGVGCAIGRHFADQGANVMFVDMDEDGLVNELARPRMRAMCATSRGIFAKN